MNRRRALFALLLAALPLPALAQDIGLAIGATPVPVTLEDLDGNAVDLSQYVGKKPVLLEFWATWCPLCRALEPQLAAAQKQYGSTLEVIVVAVGVNQSPRSVKRHLARHALPGRVVWDGKGAAVRAFSAPGTSYVVLLDAKGRVVYTGSGSGQKLLPALARLKI
jgi:thiol-disulfide isomerase/thioredoxin